MNILITDLVDDLFIDLLKENNIKYKYDTTTSYEEVLRQIHLFDGLVVRNRLKIDANFLNKAKNLKFIGRYGSGMESIDIGKASELNIQCFNSAAGNANAVAEHVLGMLLYLFKNIHKSSLKLHDLKWERELNRGLEIENKTIGIIGFGNTGSAFAEKLMKFKCEIIAYDKYKSGFQNDIIKESDMKTIYEKCDIISFHVPLSQETNYFLNSEFISKMKKPFYILNTSRGKVVSNKALVAGLKSNKILGAGLDVIENENSSFSNITVDKNLNYLLSCDNVILTPHIAGLSKESNKKLSTVLIDKILELK
ncbi:MAG: hydroxyacid dehydrogenase [Flavobacteriales bacterium]|nr:hydroxyacid dehydrogenase [Flavobacteriales bacterium]|tara:strand:- start:257 stop:1183 length:927 start_codon:yes stop_codon:yes gene_type:complete